MLSNPRSKGERSYTVRGMRVRVTNGFAHPSLDNQLDNNPSSMTAVISFYAYERGLSYPTATGAGTGLKVISKDLSGYYQLDRAVPGGKEINSRIYSGIMRFAISNPVNRQLLW